LCYGEGGGEYTVGPAQSTGTPAYPAWLWARRGIGAFLSTPTVDKLSVARRGIGRKGWVEGAGR